MRRSISSIRCGHSLSSEGAGGRRQGAGRALLPPAPSSLLPFFIVAVLLGVPSQNRPSLLFQESFEDINLKQRGWYDLADGTLASFTSREHAPGSRRGIEIHFRRGDTSPTPRIAFRHLFPESESVYLRYWVKYSDNWVGSGKPYHPHEFMFLTNADDDYVGPSRTHLTAYIEHNYQNGGVAWLGIQDGANIVEGRVGADLGIISEERAVSGCNGNPPGYRGDCYPSGDGHNNGIQWKSPAPVFLKRKGQETGWHKVEAFFRLNSIRKGQGQDDGMAQYWIDGRLVIDRRDVLFRTGAHPKMKFKQFMFAPYIGDGSPVDQIAWYDDFLVMTERPMGGEEGRGKRDEDKP